MDKSIVVLIICFLGVWNLKRFKSPLKIVKNILIF